MTSFRLSPAFSAGRAGEDHLDLGQDLGLEAGVAHLVARDGLGLEVDRQEPAVPPDLELDEPVRLGADGQVDVAPGLDLAAGDADDLVVDPQAGLLGRRAVLDPADDRLLVEVLGDRRPDGVHERDDDQGQDDVHDRAHGHDEEPLEARLGHQVVRGDRPVLLEHPLPQHLDVAAHRERG